MNNARACVITYTSTCMCILLFQKNGHIYVTPPILIGDNPLRKADIVDKNQSPCPSPVNGNIYVSTRDSRIPEPPSKQGTHSDWDSDTLPHVMMWTVPLYGHLLGTTHTNGSHLLTTCIEAGRCECLRGIIIARDT